MNKMNFKPFKAGPRSLMIALAVGLFSVFMLLQVTDSARLTQSVSYSNFLRKVENSQVAELQVVGQRAYGVLRDGKTRFETVIPSESNTTLWDFLRKHNVEFALSEPNTNFAGWYWFALMAGIMLATIAWFFFRQSKGSGGSGGSTLFSMGKSRAKLFTPSQVKVKFNHVAGAQDAKQELVDIVDFLKNPEKFKRLGAKLPKGILLVGEPGNGKTLLAKAVAGEAGCPFFTVNGSDFVEVFVGVGASRIRDLFAQARKSAPCIVFIDEIDAIGRQRGTGLGGGNDEREQTLNQLLTEMDGFEDATPVIILAATNIPDVLDKALLRPGRFDQRIEVPFPDTESRAQIIKIHLENNNVKIDPAIDLQQLAENTAGFSGADLANLVNQAALVASKHGHDMVLVKDVEEARDKLFKSQQTQNKTNFSMVKGTTIGRLYTPHQIKTRFKDVAGAHEAKEEVQDIVEFLSQPDKFKRLGAKIPKGLLLVGDPGNGKTLLARAIAGEANCPFFSISGSEFEEEYVGVGAARVRELFSQARKHAPCLIFIDEIDAVGGRRGRGYVSSVDQTLNQLLTEMDGFDASKAPVIIIAATNRVDVLDPALTRAGRFDRQVKVPFPDLKAREEILAVHAKNVKMDPVIDMSKMARGTPGFSGADLANLINESAIIASKLNQEHITIENIDEARDKLLLGKEMRTHTMTPEEIKNTAFHEAGHALITLLLPDLCDPLYKVTIIPRGMALGVTHSLPERDKYSSSRDTMEAEIMVLLGGRIAEEVVFNEVTTGAASDFQHATQLARRMVCVYGMSEKLGMVMYGLEAPENSHYSQETARQIDEEIRDILNKCYKRATELIVAHRDKLDVIAHALLERETIHAHEIYALTGITPRTDHSIR